MRIRFRWLWLLAAVALVWSVPALAETQLRFFDRDGNLLTDYALKAVYGAGVVERHVGTPDGVFLIGAEAGEKVELQVKAPGRDFETIYARVPEGLTGTWDLTANETVQVGPPENDEFRDATPANMGGTTEGSLGNATIDDHGPGAVSGGTCGDTMVQGPGVWHTVVGSGKTITASLCDAAGGSSSFDSRLSVYCGGMVGALSCVTGNDDDPECAATTNDATVSFCGAAGVEYRILVHAFGDLGGGNYALALSEGEDCSPDVECPLGEAVCGDGVVDEGEECDDGNVLPGDGCDANCAVETGACCQCLCAFIPPDGALNFTCDITTAAACGTELGGTYLGDDSICLAAGADVVLVSTPGIPIPDGAGSDSPGPSISDTITVDSSFLLFDVDVDVIATHTWHGDLVIDVTSPAGTNVKVWDRVCDIGASGRIDTIFDDDSTVTEPAACGAPGVPTPVGGGSMAPSEELIAFQGENAAGDWTITVTDWFNGDTGTLLQWSLHLNVAQLPCVAENCPALEPVPADEEDDTEADSTIDAEGASDEGLVEFEMNPGGQNTGTAQPTGDDVEEEDSDAPSRDRKNKGKNRND